MKKLIFTLFFCWSLTGFSQEISVSFENPSLNQIIAEIEGKTDYKFAFASNINPKAQVAGAFNFTNQELSVVLAELSQATRYNFKIVGNNITLTLDAAASQDDTVEGQVQDENGMPLPGATVIEKGTSNGVNTDFDGNFSLNVSEPNVTLLISFIGYETKEVNFNTSTFQVITMEESASALDEVIVTALGIKRQEKALGYATQKVQGEELTTVKGVDVGTSLTGKVAGLLVKNSTEFTAAPEIELRGENPLIVIDGVPYGNMSLRDIPSDDIETIDVLKGATASALYGFRGDSGAIMITTKKGAKNQGLSVSLNSSTMFTAGYLAIPETQSTYGRKVNTNTNEYVRSGNGSWGPPLEGQEVIQWDPVSKSMQPMPFTARGKDNFANFLEQGHILNNNISVVQQGENGSLRSSASWVNNKGQYPNSDFDKLTYSLSGDMTAGRFNLSSSISYNKQDSPNIGFSGYTGYDPMYNILVWASPDYDIRDYKDYWLVENEVQNSSYTSINNNPYFDRNERIHELNKDIFNGFFSAGYELTPWLNATFRTGYDSYTNRQVVRISKGSFQGGGTSTVIEGGSQIWGESQKGSFNIGIGRGYSINSDFLLSADHEFGDFNLEGLAGGTIFYTQDEGIESRTQAGLSVPGFYSLKGSVNPPAVNSRLYKRQVNSLYGRLSASWNDIAFLEGTLRNDWSSTLPESTRSYLYPSVATSFVVSEVLPEIDWLSFWKLRGSWTSSKTPAGIYATNNIYNITNNAWDNLSAATFPNVIRGTDVRPESSSTFEVGTVLNVLNNRAKFDVTYYAKRMYDFLRSTSISPASGYTSNYVNTDEEITRRGVEIAANINPVRTEDWRWDISFNWSKYARYYTQLDDEFSPDQIWVKEGERVDHFTLNEFQRDAQGNIIHLNGLPQYNPFHSLYGYSDPDWIWGLGTALKYKDFSLSISMDGRVGGLAQTTTEMYMWQSGNHPDSVTEERYLDATTGTANYIAEGVKVVSGEVAYDTYGNITSDTREFAPNDVAVTYENWVKRAHKGNAWWGPPSPLETYSTTFLKLREISLSYNLPQTFNDLIGASSGSVSAIGQNLALWAKDFKYSDPDGGSDNFSDPSQRYLGLNINLTF
ncbi:SusC/RagA family TonB-linked outer membrane protein [Salegentibacter sediminis]|uniref:SusC/RagA family TonB-linked outer membrane protein n=1 Tax=Salegentibacter sediminis TaxID=1930251 RepID=UPI0009BF1360|nr:SusC/RagA family TonB-linked outer membrane protein [Salegentibacter sediminis]